jgi:AcrR family transcriptional regulator
MPRDATATRERLLVEAERLFASRGVHQATSREITQAAGQRNVSALSYHFGSRTGVLHEILLRHGTPLDEQRASLLVEPLDVQPTRALVAALLLPYAGRLATPSGRNYLRIVAQLSDQFAVWRVESELTPPHLRRILAALEARGGRDPAVARERVVAAIMLMTTATAERARQAEHAAPVELDHDRFLANLADMIVAGIEAPAGPLLRPAPTYPPEPAPAASAIPDASFQARTASTGGRGAGEKSPPMV